MTIFEEVYNQHAHVPLPKGSHDLGRLRDLVNPLQMIGSEEGLLHKYKDLKGVILETLNYFGY